MDPERRTHQENAHDTPPCVGEIDGAECPRCAYSLRGVKGARCPECGGELSADAIRARLERSTWRDVVTSRQAFGACLVLFVISLLIPTPTLLRNPTSLALYVLPTLALVAFGGLRRVRSRPDRSLLIAGAVCWVLVLFVLVRAIVLT